MLLIEGAYSSTLDPKGRVKLPNGLLKQLEGINEFILVKGFETCVRLFTNESWAIYTEPIRNLSDFNPKARELKHLMLSGNNRVELDTAERILIPKMLIESAQLEKELKIICLFNKVEIWDAAVYAANFENKSAEYVSNLAAELLGNL